MYNLWFRKKYILFILIIHSFHHSWQCTHNNDKIESCFIICHNILPNLSVHLHFHHHQIGILYIMIRFYPIQPNNTSYHPWNSSIFHFFKRIWTLVCCQLKKFIHFILSNQMYVSWNFLIQCKDYSSHFSFKYITWDHFNFQLIPCYADGFHLFYFFSCFVYTFLLIYCESRHNILYRSNFYVIETRVSRYNYPEQHDMSFSLEVY